MWKLEYFWKRFQEIGRGGDSLDGISLQENNEKPENNSTASVVVSY